MKKIANHNSPDKLSWTIDPGRLYGRRGPAKSRWNIPHFAKNGVDAIISFVDIAVEDIAQIKQQGITHVYIPFEEKLIQLCEDQGAGLNRILDVFDSFLINNPQMKCMMHCNSGKDRTGFMAVYFLIVHKGLNLRQALRHVIRENPEALSAKGYKETLSRLYNEFEERKERVNNN